MTQDDLRTVVREVLRSEFRLWMKHWRYQKNARRPCKNGCGRQTQRNDAYCAECRRSMAPRVRRPCSTPGCPRSTQTRDPKCYACREGRPVTWVDPKTKAGVSRRAALAAHDPATGGQDVRSTALVPGGAKEAA